MNINSGSVATESDPFISLVQLQREHVALIRTLKTIVEKREQIERIKRFLTRAQATGKRIDGLSDRDAAQSILDYWVATLIGSLEYREAVSSPPALAPFELSLSDELADKEPPF